MAVRLATTGLAKSFGNQHILRDVSFSVAAGESLAILGKSGSGKSTLLRCLCLIDPPDQGSISLDGVNYFLDGRVLFAPWEVRRNVGMVFQDYSLFPNMTLRQNIALALRRNKSFSAVAADDRVESVATDLQISDVLDRFPSQISGGQAQRAALARAIVLEPNVLLLDEVTSSLDPVTILDVVDAIRKLRTINADMTIIFVTHLMQFAERFADRIAFIHDGSIHEIAESTRFFAAPKSDQTRSFIEANQIGRAFHEII